MSDGITEMDNLPDELLGTPFERMVFLALKEICNTIRQHREEIDELKKGGK